MQVRTYATLRPIVGDAVLDLDAGSGDTVRALLEEMTRRWPELASKFFTDDGQLSSNIHVYLNGRDVLYLDGVDMPIPEDAEIRIFPSVGGGA